MDNLSLPAELAQFAAEAVATGRYRDVSAVVTAGVRLLRQTEAAQRAALLASVVAAEADAERDGFLTIDAVMRDADGLIEEMAGPAR